MVESKRSTVDQHLENPWAGREYQVRTKETYSGLRDCGNLGNGRGRGLELYLTHERALEPHRLRYWAGNHVDRGWRAEGGETVNPDKEMYDAIERQGNGHGYQLVGPIAC